MIASNGVEASMKNFNFTCSLLLIFTERKIYSMFDEQVISKRLQTLSVDVCVIILCYLAKALTIPIKSEEACVDKGIYQL